MPDLDPATIPRLHDALLAGTLDAVELTEAYLDRIAAVDPSVRAVLALHPDALSNARASAERYRAGDARGPLDGVPLLVKDNIAVTGLPTTAGSRALADSAPPDATLVRRLRAAGAVILGKANLSEWANFRCTRSTSGWSLIGGQTRNPHALDRSPSGSSSGSAAAVAASLAQVAIGTETDGSIVSPAAVCGVVGLKPTLGAVPGEGIVPVSSAQDTAGPIGRNVVDIAITQAVLAGTRPFDLAGASLAGTRLGLWRPRRSDDDTDAVLDAAAGIARDAGAELVEVRLDTDGIGALEMPAMCAEFRHELDSYLAAAPGSGPRDLAALVEFNRRDPDELALFGQDRFEQALDAPGVTDPAHRARRAQARELARRAIDAPLATHRLDAIVTLANNPAWPIDYAAGDDYRVATATPAAVAGYPSVTIPAGFVGTLPVGISFLGGHGQDGWLLRLASAFEQRAAARRPPQIG